MDGRCGSRSIRGASVYKREWVAGSRRSPPLRGGDPVGHGQNSGAHAAILSACAKRTAQSVPQSDGERFSGGRNDDAVLAIIAKATRVAEPVFVAIAIHLVCENAFEVVCLRP